jgi:sugar transferase (PEP-CTERM system associated)
VLAHIRFFNHYIRSPYLFLAIIEFIALFLCNYFVVLYFTSDIVEVGGESVLIKVALLYALIMLLSTLAMGVYSSGLVESFLSMAVRTVVSYCLLGGIVCVFLFAIFPDFYFQANLLFESVMVSLVVILLIRRIFYSVVDNSKLKRRLFVLGAGAKAQHLHQAIKNKALIGFEVVGFIPAQYDCVALSSELLVNPVAGIYELARREKIDEVVVAVDDRRKGEGSYFPLDELLECKMKGIKITEAVTFYERELGRIELTEIYRGWMVFGSGFKYSQVRDFVKRVFDLLVCALLLLIMWPFMLITIVAIALETGFPVIYKQQRVGLNGENFWIYKFRSMSHDAEKGGKAVWAKENDVRVTRVGAFIRNTRLDELPQIYNVLRGDMSFVGPRPERPEFVGGLNEQIDYYQDRHRVKPGLMGWAQLNYSYGASVDDAANKLEYDLYYVKNHSFILDILIMVQSIEVILLGKGVR